jgi:hypothetical protein
MAIGDDFTIDYVNERVYHSSGTTVYSVNALYSWLMDTFDELGALDDEVPMSAQTPTAYTLINGWFMDDESFKYLNGGAIQTTGHNHGATYPNGVRITTLAAGGYVSAIAGDIGKTVTGGTTGDTGELLAYDNTLRKWWIRPDDENDLFDNASEALTIATGTGAGTTNAVSTTGENLWANVYSLGSIEAGTNIYAIQNGTKLTSWWSAGHVDVLIKVKEAGTEIDGASITLFAREFSDTYDWYTIDLSAGGRNAVPLASANDLNNQTASGTVAGWSNVTITFGSISRNLNNGNGLQPYDVEIDCGGRVLSQVYERLKYETRRTSTTSLDGVEGEQYISCDPVTYTPVKAAPFGTYAGGKFFGARGVWITNYDASDAKNFQLIDANGVTQNPPNVVAITISSVVSGDRVLVAETSGGSILKAQYNLAAGNDLGDPDVVVQEAIASDTPASGVIRIGDDRYPYSSWATSTFTLDTVTLTQSYSAGTDAFVPIIDEQASSTSVSNTLIYSSDIPVIIRVRKKGILPFESSGTITSTGLTVSAIRTTDSIVT